MRNRIESSRGIWTKDKRVGRVCEVCSNRVVIRVHLLKRTSLEVEVDAELWGPRLCLQRVSFTQTLGFNWQLTSGQKLDGFWRQVGVIMRQLRRRHRFSGRLRRLRLRHIIGNIRSMVIVLLSVLRL